MDRIDKINRTWRPFVGWGLGISSIATPMAGYTMMMYGVDVDQINAILLPTYPAQLATWGALAGIRQLGKNKERTAEVQEFSISRGIPSIVVEDDGIVIPEKL